MTFYIYIYIYIYSHIKKNPIEREGGGCGREKIVSSSGFTKNFAKRNGSGVSMT